ncbi:hypothetical protein ACJJTC_017621 [Scirpophaga incertulas]
MLKYSILLLFAFCIAAHGQTTNVEQCRVAAGELPINVHIEGCVQPPCRLPQQQNAVIHIIFRSPYEIHRMSTLATAYVHTGIIPLPVPYPLGPNAVTCNFLQNTNCPLVEGEMVHYTLSMPIERSFPEGTQASIEFRVVDENGTALFCLRVPIVIDPPVDAAAAQLTSE